MKKQISTFMIVIAQTGCAPFSQQAAISRAQDSFKAKQFAACLSNASRAQGYGSFEKNIDAKIMFVKAMCLDGLGEQAASKGVLEKIQKLYPDTAWAQTASQVIRQTDCNVLTE